MQNDIDTLILELGDRDSIVSQKARRQLVDIGSAAVPALISALGSRKHWVRWEAAKGLTQIGDKSAIEALAAALIDPEFDVRWLAAEGLVTIGRDSIPAVLRMIVDNPESSLVKEGAHHVLHDMDPKHLDDSMKPLMQALEGEGPVEAWVVAENLLSKLAA